MNISDEAVEAALEQLDAMGVYVSPKYMRAALEAAAPHMTGKPHFKLADWESCPKRHAGQVQHLLECKASHGND